VRGFGLLWNSNATVKKAMGCPAGAEVGVAARVQPYQHGVMIWLDTLSAGVDQSPWVVTLIDGTATRYRVPVEVPEWNDGATVPSGAFQWVLENVYTGQQNLGFALGPLSVTDAAIQRFDTGTMVWLKTPPDGNQPTIYVINTDLVNASSGAFQTYIDQSGQ